MDLVDSLLEASGHGVHHSDDQIVLFAVATDMDSTAAVRAGSRYDLPWAFLASRH